MNINRVELVEEDCFRLLENGRAQGLETLRNSLVVITGGTGFIGTWLTELLCHLNDTYNFGTEIQICARNTESFRRNCNHLASRKDVRLTSTDVRLVDRFPRETKWIIHCAANPDSRIHSTYPIDTMSIILEGTRSALRAAESCSDLRMFLNLSSGFVYGQQPLNLDSIREDFNGGPSLNTVFSTYAEAKRCAEVLCAAYRNENRIPIFSLRPFAFLGPYQNLESPWALHSFVNAAIKRQKIRVLGDGSSERSYLYAADMAYWILRILVSAESGVVYNFGSSEAISLKQVADKVASFFSPLPDIEYSMGSMNLHRKSKFIPCMDSAIRDFGFEINTPFEIALERTIKWFRQGVN